MPKKNKKNKPFSIARGKQSSRAKQKKLYLLKRLLNEKRKKERRKKKVWKVSAQQMSPAMSPVEKVPSTVCCKRGETSSGILLLEPCDSSGETAAGFPPAFAKPTPLLTSLGVGVAWGETEFRFACLSHR